jgi:hypothetical protein
MHKPLVNCKERHSMEPDGPEAIDQSNQALKLFAKYDVALVVASHAHEYQYVAGNSARHVPPMIITGGLGAPLNPRADYPIHHVLQLNVCDLGIDVAIVPFPSAERALMRSGEDEDDEH